MRSLLVVAAIAGSARADDALTVHARSASEHGCWLDLDPALLRPTLEGTNIAEQVDHTIVPIGEKAFAVLQGASWTADEEPFHPRGERAAIGLAYDLGLATVVVAVEHDRLDWQLGRGAYTDFSVSVRRTHQLSRWMTAWIALSLGYRHWNDPPPGEHDSATVMLTIGTTFR